MPTQSAIGPHTVDFLLSERGRAAAAELGAGDPAALADEQLAPLLDKLRRRYTPEEAGALVTLARLRRRAAAKFPQAEQLFFTAEALEQATSFAVAAHHAAWLDRHAPPGPLLDLGCGIGGDLLLLAQRRRVIAYELDPVRARFAEANAEALGLAEQVEVRVRDWVADIGAGALPPAAGAFADPARRREEQRIFHLDQMQPPIAALLALQQQTPALGVKVMPGVADAELPAGCGVEFISHDGVCKEAVLWFGPTRWRRKWASLLRSSARAESVSDRSSLPHGRGSDRAESVSDRFPLPDGRGSDRAESVSDRSSLPHGRGSDRAESVSDRSSLPHGRGSDRAESVSDRFPLPHGRGSDCWLYSLPGDEGDAPPLGPLAAGHVLYEPDCALIRAGCLAELCRRLGAHLFDPEIAYLVGERWEQTELAQAFLVQEVHPFSLKLLNTRLQALGIGNVELKKRGFPQEPESLRPRLKLTRQGRNGVIFFTRRGDEHLMILAERVRG